MCEGKQEAQQALVTAKVALKSDWLPGINFTAVDTLIGSGLCLETKAGSHRSLFLQGAAMIDSLLSPLLYPWWCRCSPCQCPSLHMNRRAPPILHMLLYECPVHVPRTGNMFLNRGHRLLLHSASVTLFLCLSSTHTDRLNQTIFMGLRMNLSL